MPISMNDILTLRRQAQAKQGQPISNDPNQPPMSQGQPPQGQQGGLQAAAGRRMEAPAPNDTGGEPPLTPPVPGNPSAMHPTGTGEQMGLGQAPDEVEHMGAQNPASPDQQEFGMGNIDSIMQNDQKQQAQAMSNISTPVANIMSKYGVMYSIFGLPGQQGPQ